MKKLLKSLLCISLVLILVGCQNIPKLENGQDVLISFNDASLNISVDELFNELKDRYGINLVVEMMDKKILDLEYPTDEAIKTYVDAQIEAYESYYGGNSDFLSTLQEAGYSSVDEFKGVLELNYKRSLITEDYIKENVIKEKDIEKYYNDIIHGDVSASHILLSYHVDGLSDEDKKIAKETLDKKIAEIYEKLESGTDFHEVAKEYTEDTSTKENGGRLGVIRDGQMDEDFDKALKKLKVNEYTKSAVKTTNGYVIIFKDAEKEMPKLNEVRDTIVDELINENLMKDSKLQYKALIALRESYGINITDENLNSYYENAKNNWLYSKES